MKTFRATLASSVFTAALGFVAPAHTSQDNPKPAPASINESGLHDFDFLVGEWRVQHRRLMDTPASAHWEQAFSPDGGKTWEVNWVMEFSRAS